MRGGGRGAGGRRARGQILWGLFVLLYAFFLQADSLETTQETHHLPPPLTPKAEEAIPTWRPKRENCTPPAIEQFPRPLIGPEARRSGALLFHVVVCVYAFVGLAIVCDDYFVTSLDRICEELKLSPDVAGATFMAAGSSAPELATVIIGVFFAKDDIGVSGVIGSAVFNIMFVISVCGIFGGTVCYLNWWPMCRDCVFYSISILGMLIVIYDEKISWMESSTMLLAYVGYCVALAYNAELEAWVNTFPIPCKNLAQVAQGPPAEDTKLVSYKSLEEREQGSLPRYTEGAAPAPAPAPAEQTTSPVSLDPLPNGDQTPKPPLDPAPPKQDYYKGSSSNKKTSNLGMERPEEGSRPQLAKWYLTYPIHWMAQATMPDLSQEKFRNWYPFNFMISMIWISFYSYIMVWMITVIGSTLGIPDTVMGLTFVAAGVSVPDALSSLAVVKEGYGDMAVANAIGSNVFDIFVCLGLPWFIQTAVIKPGSHVNVYSKGLMYSTMSLLSTVVFLLVATHMNGWKLDKKFGYILMLWYLCFISFASLYELNVFGMMNPPECRSDY